jgi:hypothetical protein
MLVASSIPLTPASRRRIAHARPAKCDSASARPEVSVGGTAYVSRMSKSKASSGGGFGALLGLMLIIWVIVKLIWWILGAAILVGLYFVVRAIVRESRRRADLKAAHRAAVAARADQQHKWVLQGDDRGIYGVEGAELMHYLYPAADQVKRLNRGR